jgi:hypothetical protein
MQLSVSVRCLTSVFNTKRKEQTKKTKNMKFLVSSTLQQWDYKLDYRSARKNNLHKKKLLQ